MAAPIRAAVARMKRVARNPGQPCRLHCRPRISLRFIRATVALQVAQHLRGARRQVARLAHCGTAGLAHIAAMPDHLPSHILVIMAVFLLAGLVKGVSGMGLPTVAMGALGAVMPPATAAALLVVPSFVTNIWQL